MNKKFFGVGLVLAAGLSVVVALTAFGGDSSASSAGPSSNPPALAAAVEPGGTLAIAIGQLVEDDGETATVDLRATSRDGAVGGALRFFSDEHGYYNGGVRTLSVENGVITVTGAGGLFPPEGGRQPVRYTATFSIDDGATEITVRGRNGYSYTMSGTLDGLVWAGERASQNATTTQ